MPKLFSKKVRKNIVIAIVASGVTSAGFLVKRYVDPRPPPPTAAERRALDEAVAASRLKAERAGRELSETLAKLDMTLERRRAVAENDRRVISEMK